MGFVHFPPLDDVAADRLRAATAAWSELLGELSAVGLRPYLELEQGDATDALRLYCELDDGLLIDLSIDDEAFPDAPGARDGDWVVFVEGHEGGYRAEVTIPGDIPFAQLARRLVDLTDAVALGEQSVSAGLVRTGSRAWRPIWSSRGALTRPRPRSRARSHWQPRRQSSARGGRSSAL